VLRVIFDVEMLRCCNELVGFRNGNNERVKLTVASPSSYSSTGVWWVEPM